jgi:hypothetical protein
VPTPCACVRTNAGLDAIHRDAPDRRQERALRRSSLKAWGLGRGLAPRCHRDRGRPWVVAITQHPTIATTDGRLRLRQEQRKLGTASSLVLRTTSTSLPIARAWGRRELRISSVSRKSSEGASWRLLGLLEQQRRAACFPARPRPPVSTFATAEPAPASHPSSCQSRTPRLSAQRAGWSTRAVSLTEANRRAAPHGWSGPAFVLPKVRVEGVARVPPALQRAHAEQHGVDIVAPC